MNLLAHCLFIAVLVSSAGRRKQRAGELVGLEALQLGLKPRWLVTAGKPGGGVSPEYC